MSIREAADSLIRHLCPYGPTFRPRWYQCVGIGNNVLVVYVLRMREARKAMGDMERWEGFPVRITQSGPLRLL